MKKYIKIAFGVSLVASILPACVTKKYELPEVKTTNLFRDQNKTDSSNLSNMPWKALFADTLLQGIIQEGLSNNLDLKIALERMAEAQAGFNLSKASFFPSLNAGIGVTRAKISKAALNLPEGLGINLTSTTYQAQLSSSWEADIWGKLSSSKRSSYAVLLQSEAAKHAVQTQLIAEIANNYYLLCALDRQLEITLETILSRTAEVETMKQLLEGAIVNGAAVVQSEANRYAAEVSIPDLKRSIRETENNLSILLARVPGKIIRAGIETQKIDTLLKTGLPLQLLRNRPDVIQAEYGYRASFENTNIARTFFYPALTITAQGGLSSLKVGDFFDGSVFYNAIGGVTQPIFSRGENKARLRTAEARQQQALYSFQKTLLSSGAEVSDYLYSFKAAREKELTRDRQISALTKSVSFTRDLLRYSSSTNYTDVLTSEQSLLRARLDGVSDRLQQLQSIVNLYQALGGGWKP